MDARELNYSVMPDHSVICEMEGKGDLSSLDAITYDARPLCNNREICNDEGRKQIEGF